MLHKNSNSILIPHNFFVKIVFSIILHLIIFLLMKISLESSIKYYLFVRTIIKNITYFSL